MSNLLQTGAEFEKKLKERAESTETMLNDEFRKLEKSVSKAVTSNETKIKDAIALFTASTEELRIPLYSITDWHRSPISDSHPFDQPGT